MSYFPEDIPFMSKEELRENGIRIPKDVPDTNAGDNSEIPNSSDTISRQAVIDWASKIPIHDLSDGRGLCRVIFAEDFLKALKQLLLVTERTGHWIHREDMDFLDKNKVTHAHFMCSGCGLIHDFLDYHTAQYNYCPQCGAHMKGGETE